MGPNARPAAKCTRRNDEMLCCWHVRLEHESELFGYLKAPRSCRGPLPPVGRAEGLPLLASRQEQGRQGVNARYGEFGDSFWRVHTRVFEEHRTVPP
jgi:hypothetical protein